MREIKFRAWDIKYNKFVLWEDIAKNNILGAMANNNNRQISNSILMQYTGLKDRQGVEIYEGDIVKIELGTNNYENAEIQFNIQDGMYEVYFINSEWIEHFNDWTNISHFEVIGNIYENKELLDVEK